LYMAPWALQKPKSFSKAATCFTFPVFIKKMFLVYMHRDATAGIVFEVF
jgi:hypothetical protein